jgi:hypothetical protein
MRDERELSDENKSKLKKLGQDYVEQKKAFDTFSGNISELSETYDSLSICPDMDHDEIRFDFIGRSFAIKFTTGSTKDAPPHGILTSYKLIYPEKNHGLKYSEHERFWFARDGKAGPGEEIGAPLWQLYKPGGSMRLFEIVLFNLVYDKKKV